jgi:kynurenine formamidase
MSSMSFNTAVCLKRSSGFYLANLLVAFCLLALSSNIRADNLNNSKPALIDAIRAHRMVDLTHTFGTNTPVWKGFGQATIAAASDPTTHEPYTIKNDGFHASVYTLVGQYGTHIDPPAHFAEGGLTMDQIPLEQMILPMVVFDITPQLKDQPAYCLTIADILQWEARHGKVPSGSFAALRTDMFKDWEKNPDRFKRSPFPAWTPEAIRFLFEKRGISAVGHEAMDTDNTPDLDSERWLLKHGHYQIEVMANLDQVPATGAVVIATWPKVQNGLGFPARVFALIPR